MAMGTPGERPDRRGFPIRDSSRSHRHKGRADSSAERLRHPAAAPSPSAWPSNATFGSLLPGVDHLPHTHHHPRNPYTRGALEHSVVLADALERLFASHDASTSPAVTGQPVSAFTGVLSPSRG